MFASYCFAQHPGKDECSLQPDNKDWLLSFKDASDTEVQLELISNKLLQDATYFDENPPLENLNDRSVFGSIPCNDKCTLRFVLMYGKHKALALDLHDEPALQNILDEFTSESIKRIEVKEKRERDIYGHSNKTRSGIVIFTEDKALIKTVKRTLRDIKKAKAKRRP
jgi:hypothetical protein